MPAIVNLLFHALSADTTISFRLVLPLVSVLSLLAGVGGHLLLWLVLLRDPRRRTRPSSVLLLNLSLADVAALLTLPCVLLAASARGWVQLGGGVCVFLGFVTSLAAGVDVFSLAALAALRYRMVAPPPRRAPRAGPARVAGTVAVIWLVSVAMALPKVTYIRFDGGCTWSVGRGQWLGFLVPAFLVYYVAPLACIGLHCGLVVKHLHRCRGSTLAADRRNKKATALLIGSTLAFAVSWLPYYALEFVNVASVAVGDPSAAAPPPNPTFDPETEVSLLWEVASLSAILLVCLAPCWNPPLYFLLSRPAVRQLRALLPSVPKRWRSLAIGRRVGPAPPPPPPRLPPSNLGPAVDRSVTHHALTHRLTQ